MCAVEIGDRGTQDIYDGVDSKAARRALPSQLHDAARDLLDVIEAAASLLDLAALPGGRLEKLKGDRKGQHSLRINDQYRVCFTWTDDGAVGVEIVDYH
jgi:proteic killer suppression protein